MTIIMVICYVFAPVHHFLFKEMHGIFHFFEEKSSEFSRLISHHHHENIHEADYEKKEESHTHGFLAGHTLPKNQPPMHLDEEHHHGVLSFLSAILGALEDRNSGDETLMPNILDKHLLSFWSFETLKDILLLQKRIWYVSLKTYQEAVYLLEHPPRPFLLLFA